MLLSIDPGVNNCGLAVIDTSGNTPKVLETYNVKNARKFTDVEKKLEIEFNTRVVKVHHILDSVELMLAKYPDISFVAIEAPFYSALTPVAYGSLLEVISALKYQILVPRRLKFRMIEPLTVKKMFIHSKLSKGMTAKEVMRQFLIAKKEAKEIIIEQDIDAMTEHEVDAVAVGFVHQLFINEEAAS